MYQRIRARVVLADAEPEFTDDGDGVARKGQTAVEHRDEGSTPRLTVFREASRGMDISEIRRELLGRSNANVGGIGACLDIENFTAPSSQRHPEHPTL